MASRNIIQRVASAFSNGRGHTEDKLESLAEELEEIIEDDDESEAHRLAAMEDLEYVEGVLETPGPFLTDLAYIRKRHK